MNYNKGDVGNFSHLSGVIFLSISVWTWTVHFMQMKMGGGMSRNVPTKKRLRGRLAILWPHYKHLRHFYMGDPPPSCMGKSFVPWQLYIQGRIQGEGAGVARSPPPEMPCGFLIQLVWVFCINICLRHQSVTPFLSGAPCPKKNRGSPLISFVREARRRRIGRASSSHIISQTM